VPIFVTAAWFPIVYADPWSMATAFRPMLLGGLESSRWSEFSISVNPKPKRCAFISWVSTAPFPHVLFICWLAVLRTGAVFSVLRPSFISANQIRWPPHSVCFVLYVGHLQQKGKACIYNFQRQPMFTHCNPFLSDVTCPGERIDTSTTPVFGYEEKGRVRPAIERASKRSRPAVQGQPGLQGPVGRCHRIARVQAVLVPVRQHGARITSQWKRQKILSDSRGPR
jgi:hypothetical protein